MRQKIILMLLSLSIFKPSDLNAWDSIGHRVITQIAENHLSARAREEVRKILDGENFVEVANWADDMRADANYDFALVWHYMEIPDGKKYDPTKIPEDLAHALPAMEKILRGTTKPPVYGKVTLNKKEALKFFIHFVGDVHMPLHVGNGRDEGGNFCLVKWFGESRRLEGFWNIHAVWDSAIIDSLKLSSTELADYLDVKLSKPNEKKLQAGSYLDWANESRALHSLVYPVNEKQKSPDKLIYCKKYSSQIDPFNIGAMSRETVAALRQKIEFDSDIPSLGFKYRFNVLPTLKGQLHKAGIRLAGALNSIFR